MWSRLYCKCSSKTVQISFIIFQNFFLLTSPNCIFQMSGFQICCTGVGGQSVICTSSHFDWRHVSVCMFIFVLKILNNSSQVKIINRWKEAAKGNMLLERWMWKGASDWGWVPSSTTCTCGLHSGHLQKLRDISYALVILGNSTLWEKTKHWKRSLQTIKQMVRLSAKHVARWVYSCGFIPALVKRNS